MGWLVAWDLGWTLTSGRRLALHGSPGQKMKRNRYRLHQERFHLCVTKEFFPVRTIRPWNSLAVSGGDWTRCQVTSSGLASQKCLHQLICQGPFQPGLFSDPVILIT